MLLLSLTSYESVREMKIYCNFTHIFYSIPDITHDNKKYKGENAEYALLRDRCPEATETQSGSHRRRIGLTILIVL